MSIMRKSILSLSLLAITTLHAQTLMTESNQESAVSAPMDNPVTISYPASTTPQSNSFQNEQTAPVVNDNFLKKGIGIQAGIRFHNPCGFNNFVTDLWRSYLSDYVFGEVDKKKVGPGVFLKLNGTIDLGSRFHITPFAEEMWAGKQFSFRGDIVNDLHFNTFTTMGGLNLWVRILNYDLMTLRLGAGGYAAYSVFKFSDDDWDFKLSGSGYGFRGLLGTEIRVNRQVTVTLDCSVPYGRSNLYDKDNKRKESPVKFPTKFEHGGFELTSGVMFYF